MTREDAERYAARFQEAIAAFLRRGGRTPLNFHREALPHSRLVLLFLLDARGPARVSELAEALGVSAPAVTGLANELEKAGYVERATDPEDRRATRLALTRAGRGLVAEVRERRRRKAVELLQHFEAEEIEAFMRVVTRLIELLREDRKGMGA